MALPPNTWHGSTAKFPPMQLHTETPSPLPLLPLRSTSLELSVDPVLPHSLRKTEPSSSTSNSTGPISLPLHTLIPSLPSLSYTIWELRDTHNSTSGLFPLLMYAIGIRFNICTVGHFTVARPPKISEVSSHALKPLAAHWTSWNIRGLHDSWDLLQFILIQLFIYLGTLATELWASYYFCFLRFSEVETF